MMGNKRKNIFIAVISALCITACSNDNKDHSDIDNADTPSANGEKEQEVPSKPWTPYIYNDSDEIVHRDKNKLDEFVVNLIASASKYIYKDTYETTKEYNKRIELWDHSPFSKEDIYLIEYKYPTSMNYNADKQTYEMMFGGISCNNGCNIGGFEIKEKYRSVYTRGNYEYRPTVVTDYTISIVPPEESLSKVGLKDRYAGWKLKAECPMPIEQAKQSRQSHVYIGYLVRILDFKITDAPWGEKGKSYEDYPQEITEKTIKIPANILGYVCYSDDGKIFYKSNKPSK